MDQALFRNLPDMEHHLEDLLTQIPAGRVTTYSDLSEALGNKLANRWVGHYLLHHEHTDACPCHRVVCSTGELGSYIDGGAAAQARQLKSEGVPTPHKRVDLKQYRFAEFDSSRPLARLKQAQDELAELVSLEPPSAMPQTVGGVDVSYIDGDHERGVAAYTLVDAQTCQLLWSTTIVRPVTFPYITSYLAFREMPLLLDLMEKVKAAEKAADVVLVDGSGILHQRSVGIATHLGIVAELRTIGVAKKLLCGQVDTSDIRPGESRPVNYEDRQIGIALRTGPRSKKPLYVSPGQGVSLDYSERVVKSVSGPHRLPEPLFWADHLSRREAKQVLSS